MRPIKFRIWDKEEKKYFVPIYEAYKGNLLDLSISHNGRILRRTIEHPAEDECCFKDKYEILLFTGLTDRDQKELFNKDIIQFKYWDKFEENGYGFVKGVIEFENGCFVVKEFGFDYDYNDPERTPDTLFNWLSSENCYLIGNVFDNPELLKP